MFLEQVLIYKASLSYLGRGGNLVYNHIAPFSNTNYIAVIAGPFKEKKPIMKLTITHRQSFPHTSWYATSYFTLFFKLNLLFGSIF